MICTYISRHNLALVNEDLGQLAKAEEQWRLVCREAPKYGPGRRGSLSFGSTRSNYRRQQVEARFIDKNQGSALLLCSSQHVAAEVRLGRCLDLADTLFTDLLRACYDGTYDQ